MRPITFTFLYATLLATFVVGLIALGFHKFFQLNPSTWGSPWLWVPFLILWVRGFDQAWEAALKLEALFHMDRDHQDKAKRSTP